MGMHAIGNNCGWDCKTAPFNENNVECELLFCPFEPHNSTISEFTVIRKVENPSFLCNADGNKQTKRRSGVSHFIICRTSFTACAHLTCLSILFCCCNWSTGTMTSNKSKNVAQHWRHAAEKHWPDFLSRWQFCDHSNTTKGKRKIQSKSGTKQRFTWPTPSLPSDDIKYFSTEKKDKEKAEPQKFRCLSHAQYQ